MKYLASLLIALVLIPLTVFADDQADINDLVDRANQIVARIHELQSLLGETPGSRGVDLTDGEVGVEVKITHKLIFGSRDRDTDGDVSLLQQFLYNQYYYDGQISGTFGKSTKDAVVDLQNENKQYLKITQGTGVVDGATRELIRRLSVGEVLDDSIASFNEPISKPSPKPSIDKPKPKRSINVVKNGQFDGNIRKNLEASFTAYGGIGGYVWKITGKLPPGLDQKKDGDRLVISGTTTDSGDFPITVKATDRDGFSGSVNAVISVGPEIIESVTIIRPSPNLEWLKNSYEVIGWRGPADGVYEIKLNYYKTDCPSGVCTGLVPSASSIIASGISSRTYSWSVGRVSGGPVPVAGQYYSVTVCETRTRTCSSSGGFRIVDKGSDLSFSAATDGYVYRSGSQVAVKFTATSKSSLRKVINFPNDCQLNWQLISGNQAVIDSSDVSGCSETPTSVVITPFGSYTWSGIINTTGLAKGVYVVKASIGAGREAQTKITIQ